MKGVGLSYCAACATIGILLLTTSWQAIVFVYRPYLKHDAGTELSPPLTANGQLCSTSGICCCARNVVAVDKWHVQERVTCTRGSLLETRVIQ